MSDGRPTSSWESLDVRINGPFNNKSPDEMVRLLDKFMRKTGIENIYRIHFEKGMFLAQHQESLDDEKVRMDYEHALRTFEHPENRGTFLDLTYEQKSDVLRVLRSSERPGYKKDFLALTKLEMKSVQRDKLQTTDDRNSRRMVFRKWSLPPTLWRLVALCALGAIVQGWDQSAVNAAQVYYQDALRIRINPPDGTNAESERWKLGLVNSAPYLCCVVSCWFAHPLNKWFGRRWTIFISCLFSAAFPFAQAFSQTWQTVFLFRLLLGLGIGPKSVTIPIYVAEAAPQNIRGGLVMMWQTFTAFGIMLGYLTGVALQNVGAAVDDCSSTSDQQKLLAPPCSLRWRLMIGSPMVAPILLMLYIFTQPESPRWLIAKGHRLRRNEKFRNRAKSYYINAFEGLIKLRHTKLQAARDMFLVYHLLEKEQDMVIQERDRATRWYHQTVFHLVAIRRNRRALIASLSCMFAQQFCGVNVIIYYSSVVFKAVVGGTNQKVFLYSMGFGIINFVFALPAFYLIDAFGRRSLLLVTFPLLGLSQLLIAFAFVGPQRGSASGLNAVVTDHWALTIAGMYLFGIFYSSGEGPIPFVYSAESMPLYIRDLGMSCVTSINWFFDWLIAFTLPKFFKEFNPWGAFLWYALWCFVLWFLIFFFVPETRMLSLEQLDMVFRQPTRDFWRWAWNEEARWVINRLRFWRPATGEQRPQLYDSLVVDQQNEIEVHNRSSSTHSSFGD